MLLDELNAKHRAEEHERRVEAWLLERAVRQARADRSQAIADLTGAWAAMIGRWWRHMRRRAGEVRPALNKSLGKG